MFALAEVEAIANAAAVVDREHDEALGCEVLVHRIGVGVVVHGGVAEEHLAIGAAVEEEDRGARGVRGCRSAGEEELAVEVQAVDGGEEDLAGRDEGRGVVGGGDVERTGVIVPSLSMKAGCMGTCASETRAAMVPSAATCG